MRTHNALVDEDGQKWEFLYDEDRHYQLDGDGRMQYVHTVVRSFRYRREGETDWLALPPWADVATEWKINLCFFDEDEETEELTFWPLAEPAADFTIGLPGGDV